MLSLLWTRLARKFGFWSKLLAVSSFLHIFLFFLIFFIYGQKSALKIDINRSILNSGAPVVFMNIETGAKVGVCGSKKCYNGGSACARKEKNVKKEKPSKLSKKEELKSKFIKKSKKLALKASKVKNNKREAEKKKKLEKKIIAKKLQDKKAKEKELLKKKLQAQKLQEKKLIKEKLEAQKLKEALDKKKEEVARIEKEAKLAAEIAKEAEKLKQEACKETKKLKKDTNVMEDNSQIDNQLKNNDQESNLIKNNSQENIVINMQELGLNTADFEGKQLVCFGRQEAEAEKIKYEIIAELAKHWSPPEGMSKELSCEVNISVDWTGKVTQAKIVKSSGVLMYDISIRVGLSKSILPSSLYGKDISIGFGQ